LNTLHAETPNAVLANLRSNDKPLPRLVNVLQNEPFERFLTSQRFGIPRLQDLPKPL
jgi:hypothetical protein